ncbi:coiled-coil domain-containing protein [Micavibrio aeruginosavorus]|uniref:Uncharacterized protein n=1 Tax=Micavibrio aeruginosavorus (strain ARL-13) TaxID=856793 RepID=G2KPV5_MICAA|nr:hypothetical protein [Micavibrio aeruginosavorus]AEP10323.1 hypothetical protein MICA_2015 [Micavibrio aeruginosavorus ARL-13]
MSDQDESDHKNDQDKVEKLYTRLGKIMARLRDDSSDEELLVSLRHTLSYMRKINELEESFLAPGDHYEQLSFERIYTLASSGGSDSQLQELADANSSFAEVNQLLTETIQNLTYRLDAMKRQSADEIIGRKDGSFNLRSDIKSVMSDVSALIVRLEKTLPVSIRDRNGAPDLSGLRLDEQFVRDLAGGQDISADLMRLAPDSLSWAGALLRKTGLAYDYKDVSALRQLLSIVLKANRKLADLNADILPNVQEQLNLVRENLALVELYAGHDERQSPQYKEALEHIERLESALDQRATLQGSIDDLQAQLNDMLSQHKAMKITLDSLNAEIFSLREQRHELKSDLIQRACDVLTGQRVQRDRPAPTSEKSGMSFWQGMLGGGSALHQNDNNSPPARDPALDEQPLSAEQMALKTREREIARLRADLARLKIDHSAEIAELKSAHRTELAGAFCLAAETESGRLVQRLESEIAALRQVALQADQDLQKSQQDKAALETRVETWVQSQPALEAQVEKWQKRYAIKSAFIAAACGVTAVAGYGAGAAILDTMSHGTMMAWYFGLATAVSGVGGFIGARVSDVNRSLKQCTKIGVGFSCAGAMVAAVGTGPIVFDRLYHEMENERNIHTEKRKIFESCAVVPCQFQKKDDGTYEIIRPASSEISKKSAAVVTAQRSQAL